MHAVVVNVTVSDEQGSLAALREQVVPRISQAPGFVAGYWTPKGQRWAIDVGLGVRGRSRHRERHGQIGGARRGDRRQRRGA